MGSINSPALPVFLSNVKARRDKMVELTRRVMSDNRGTMSAECDADGLQLTAYGPPITVARQALPDSQAGSPEAQEEPKDW